MKRPARVNATTQVVEAVRLAIQCGQLKVGDKLPKESELAEQLGVGRSSLREGIKILNTYGIVEARQGEGTFIVDNGAQKFFEYLGFFPNRENDRYYLELRRAVETGNIVLVCGKVDAATIKRLRELTETMNEKHNIEEYIEADVMFHHLLLSFLNNPMMIQLNNMLVHMRSNLLNRLFCYPEVIADAYKEHNLILDALCSQDLLKCIEAVNYHLDTTMESVNRLLDLPFK